MQITKGTGMSLIATIIVFAVYNVVAFVIPFPQGGGFWTGYSFSLLAILMTSGVSFFALGRDGMNSKFYGLPLVDVVWRYLVVQVIVGFVEMAFPAIPYRYEIVLNVILLGACLLGLIAVNAGREEIERSDEKVKEKVFFIRSLQGDVETLMDKMPDTAVRKTLKDLAETIRYSDPLSSPQLSALENKIDARIAELDANVERGDTNGTKALCGELQRLFAERNRKCKLLK
jgi:hypothetical protein